MEFTLNGWIQIVFLQELIYKSGKAPKIIFTRGKMPWDKSSNTEGDILANLL
jgi:hypothetical protein